MKVKRLAVFLLAGVISLSQSNSVHAQMQPNSFRGSEDITPISPKWVNTNDITLDLYFDSGEACCSGMIRALSGTTRINATFKLERKNSSGWAFEESWSQSSNTNSLSFYDTEAVSLGYTYRLSVTADVTRYGETETVSTSVEGYY